MYLIDTNMTCVKGDFHFLLPIQPEYSSLAAVCKIRVQIHSPPQYLETCFKDSKGFQTAPLLG